MTPFLHDKLDYLENLVNKSILVNMANKSTKVIKSMERNVK